MAALIENRKARFDYDILETFEAGVELFGFEVKSVRKGQGSLVGAHIIIRGGEAFLVGATIPPYQEGNTPENYDPARNRRLLLTKKEIALLADKESQRGLTIVPLSVYNRSRKLKVGIAVARGKKKYDKRETIKKRDTDRDVRRTLKNI